MFLNNDTGMKPIDKALALLVHDYQKKKDSESYRENRRGKTQYPPSGDGTKQFGNLGRPKPKRGPFRTLQEIMANAPQGSGPGGTDFNPTGRLDTSQVEDRRDPRAAIMEMLHARGAMAGDGRAERPSPMFGFQAPDAYPYQAAPAGKTGGDPQDVMLQVLRQFLAGKKRTMM